MELLNLLLYTTAFSQLTYLNFFDFCLINIFLKYAYHYKPISYNPNTVDFTTFFVTFIHFTLHITLYYGDLCICKCEQNNYGKHIIYSYKVLNKYYLNARNKLLYYGFLTPFKYVLKKIVFSTIPNQNIENFKKNMEKNIYSINHESKEPVCTELKTNKEIDLFLDKILLENKNKYNKNE